MNMKTRYLHPNFKLSGKAFKSSESLVAFAEIKPTPINPAIINIHAENIGISPSGIKLVSIYFIEVSITPDPKNNNNGSQSPFNEKPVSVRFLTDAKYTATNANN